MVDYSYTFSNEYARQAKYKQTLANRYSYYLKYYYSVIEEIFDALISSCDEYMRLENREILNSNMVTGDVI